MKTRILFLCVANSARSQMAEGLARHLLDPEKFEIESAGSHPSGVVHSMSIKAMAEMGVDISQHHSKSVEDIDHDFAEQLDYAVTLCKEETCPHYPNPNTKKLHWPMPDPSGSALTETEELENFIKIRDQIRDQIMDQFG